MRSIRLIETPVTNSAAGDQFRLNYKKEFLAMVEIVPEGVTTSQMANAIKIGEALRKTSLDSLLILEDAEWEYLRARAEAHKFSLVCPEVVAMVNAVKNAEQCEAPHLTGEKKDKAAKA